MQLRSQAALLLCATALCLTACRTQTTLVKAECDDEAAQATAATTATPATAERKMQSCSLPQFPDRGYDMLVPDGDGPFPVLFALHGGGGNRNAATRLGCPGGDFDDPRCLHTMAVERGYLYVSPDGMRTQTRLNMRTWNAGGGTGEWRCIAGPACDEGFDEISYFNALLDDLAERVPIDRTRLYATGISNGGAMSYRLACQLPGVRAIFPVGGALQWTTNATCEPAAPVALAHAHGTDDPCWPYETGSSSCPFGTNTDKTTKGVDPTMLEWGALLNCGAPGDATMLPDTSDDGITTTVTEWSGCDAPMRLYRMEGAGHTWPNGHSYAGERVVGKTTTDWGNEVILDWFDAN